MSDAGIPDPPGRKEVVERMTEARPYKATFREKHTGLIKTERIMAINFQDALKQAREFDAKLQSLLEDW